MADTMQLNDTISFLFYYQQITGKRKREDGSDDHIQGAARIRKFLQDLAALPVDQLGRDESLAQLKVMKSALDKDGAANPWLQQIL